MMSAATRLMTFMGLAARKAPAPAPKMMSPSAGRGCRSVGMLPPSIRYPPMTATKTTTKPMMKNMLQLLPYSSVGRIQA